MMAVLRDALDLLQTVVRLVGLASDPEPNRAAIRFEMLRLQTQTQDALARQTLEDD